jgi:hypothetical protein
MSDIVDTGGAGLSGKFIDGLSDKFIDGLMFRKRRKKMAWF